MSDSSQNNLSSDKADRQLAAWIEEFRPSLRYMVELRMDRRLRSRVDPSDILQEAFIEAAQRLEKYQQQPDMPPHLWLRFLAQQQLLIAWRKHGQAKARDIRREQSLDDSAAVSGEALFDCLIESGTTPSQHLSRAEDIARMHDCLNQLENIDREVLVMRHFERLSVADTARVLNISEAAASQRYYRALKKISQAIRPSTSNPDTPARHEE